MDPIAKYYADKRDEAKRLREELARELAKPERDHKKIQQLTWALELAEYVGD